MITKFVFPTILATLLAGCGQEAPKAPAATQNTAAANTPKVESAGPSTEVGDKSKPLAEYVQINSGRQLLNYFVGLHKMTDDDWKRAADTANSVSTDPDVFKQMDFVKEFKATAESEGAKAAGHRYVYFDLPDLMPRDPIGGHLDAYDFNLKGFPVPFFASKKTRDPMTGMTKVTHSRLGFTDTLFASLDLVNSDEFSLLKVEDESLARSIEAGRKKGQLVDGVTYRPDLRMRAFVFITGTTTSPMRGSFITGQVMKIQLRDVKDNVVAEI